MVTSASPSTIAWLDTWQEATVQARAQRRPILVDVYQDNCGGCDKLNDVTLQDPNVATAIVDRFVPVKLHLTRDRAFTREHQVFWTPTILVGDHSAKIRYTSPNYLPPTEFLDMIDIAESMVNMRWQGYQQAIDRLQGVVNRSPDGPLTAEAIYWRGIAAYFRDRKSSASASLEWRELLDRFPDSIWAKRIP